MQCTATTDNGDQFFKDLLIPYLNGNLTQRHEMELKKHFRTCGTCWEELELLAVARDLELDPYGKSKKTTTVIDEEKLFHAGR